MIKPRLAGGVMLGLTIGMAIGVGTYTFVYARGYSYMTDNAEACVNCHVMQDQFSGWLKSSHRSVAVCNDCHTPPGLVAKYATKARNGFWHSYYFTGPEANSQKSFIAIRRARRSRCAGYCSGTGAAYKHLSA